MIRRFFLPPALQDKLDSEGQLSLEGYPEFPPVQEDPVDSKKEPVTPGRSPKTKKEMQKEELKRRKREVSRKRFEDAQEYGRPEWLDSEFEKMQQRKNASAASTAPTQPNDVGVSDRPEKPSRSWLVEDPNWTGPGAEEFHVPLWQRYV